MVDNNNLIKGNISDSLHNVLCNNSNDVINNDQKNKIDYKEATSSSLLGECKISNSNNQLNIVAKQNRKRSKRHRHKEKDVRNINNVAVNSAENIADSLIRDHPVAANVINLFYVYPYIINFKKTGFF